MEKKSSNVKNKSNKKKNLKDKLKKFKLPLGKKSLFAALMTPGIYQGLKGLDLNKDDLKLLDFTDEDVRQVYSEIGKEKSKEYSGLKGKGQLAADVLGTLYDFSPFSLITDSDVGFGSKTLGAGTLDNYTPKQLQELRRKAMTVPKVTMKKGGKVIKSKTKKNKKSRRPKGVGCATRGYGKAMKSGK